jgi:hypothetical protein
MKNDVTLIHELRCDGLVVNRINRVMKPWILFEVTDVFNRSGRQIVDYEDLVAALQIRVGKVRSNEAGAAGYEYTQR